MGNIKYWLNLSIPDTETDEVPVNSKIALGSSPDDEICVEGCDLATHHCIFRVHNKILSLHHLGDDDATSINNQLLKNGKMYILCDGDIIKTKSIEVLIREGEKQKKEPTQKYSDIEIDIDEINEEIANNPPHEKEKPKDEAQQVDIKDILKKQNKEKKKIKPNKQASAKKSHSNDKKEKTSWPGPLVRIYALLVNFSFAYGVTYFIIPKYLSEDIFASISKTLINPIQGIFSLFAGLLDQSLTEFIVPEPLITFYITYILMDIFFHLIFGTSLPFFLLGIQSERDSFISRRTRGVIRSIIGAITLPLIVFDLTAILGTRTPKELITSTKFRYTVGALIHPSLAILFPVLIIISIFSSLIENTYLLYNLDQSIFQESISISRPKSKNIINMDKRNSIPQIVSKQFQLNITSPLPDNIIFIPLFTKEKSSIDSVNIFDKKKMTKIKLSKISSISLFEILLNAPKGNPLFHASFPIINDLIKSKKKPIMDKKLTNELAMLIQTSLSINLTELPSIISQYGPFINGYVKFRDNMISKLNISYVPKAKIIQLGNTRFIQFSTPDNLPINETIIIPITLATKIVPIFKLSYREKAVSFAEKFQITFLNKVEWSWETENTVENTSKYTKKRKTPFATFEFIDFINSFSTDKQMAKTDGIKFGKYFNHISQNALENENDRYIRTIGNFIKSSTDFFSKYTNNNDRIAKELINKLNAIYKDFDE